MKKIIVILAAIIAPGATWSSEPSARAVIQADTDSITDADSITYLDTETISVVDTSLTGGVAPAAGVSSDGSLKLKGGIAPSHAGRRGSNDELSIVHLGWTSQRR